MALNSAEFFNCSLTRYLEEVSRIESENGKGQFSAAMLSFLGYFQPSYQIPDYRNLEGLMEVLTEQKLDDLLAEVKRPCIQCPNKVDCPVGRIVLKS